MTRCCPVATHNYSAAAKLTLHILATFVPSKVEQATAVKKSLWTASRVALDSASKECIAPPTMPQSHINRPNVDDATRDVESVHSLAIENAHLHNELIDSLVEEIQILSEHLARAKARAHDGAGPNADTQEVLEENRLLRNENAELKQQLEAKGNGDGGNMSWVKQLYVAEVAKTKVLQEELDAIRANGKAESATKSAANDGMGWVKQLYQAEVAKSQLLERELEAVRQELRLADEVAQLDKQIIDSLENNDEIRTRMDDLHEDSFDSGDAEDESDNCSYSDEHNEEDDALSVDSMNEPSFAEKGSGLSGQELEVTNATELLLAALMGKAVTEFSNAAHFSDFALDKAGLVLKENEAADLLDIWMLHYSASDHNRVLVSAEENEQLFDDLMSLLLEICYPAPGKTPRCPRPKAQSRVNGDGDGSDDDCDDDELPSPRVALPASARKLARELAGLPTNEDAAEAAERAARATERAVDTAEQSVPSETDLSDTQDSEAVQSPGKRPGSGAALNYLLSVTE